MRQYYYSHQTPCVLLDTHISLSLFLYLSPSGWSPLAPTIPSFIHSFIHSGHFYSAPSSPLPLRGAPDYSTDTVLEFHAEGLAQGPYVTARAGVEPTTL